MLGRQEGCVIHGKMDVQPQLSPGERAVPDADPKRVFQLPLQDASVIGPQGADGLTDHDDGFIPLPCQGQNGEFGGFTVDVSSAGFKYDVCLGQVP